MVADREPTKTKTKAAVAKVKKSKTSTSSAGKKVISAEAVQSLEADGLSLDGIALAQSRVQLMEQGGTKFTDDSRLEEIKKIAAAFDDKIESDAKEKDALRETLQKQKAALDKKSDVPKHGSGRRKQRQKQAVEGTLNQTEQAFLLQNLDSLDVENNAPTPEELPRLIVANTRGNLLNKLTSSKKMLALMGATTTEISSLTPYIRLYKKDTLLGQPRIREFKFSSHSPDLQEYFASGQAASRNIGLKSFDFESTGKNTFTAPFALIANLVLLFKSLSDLDLKSVQDPTAAPWIELLPGEMGEINLGDPSFVEKTSIAIGETVVQEGAKFVPNLKRQLTSELDDGARKSTILADLGYNYSLDALKDDKPDLISAISATRLVLTLSPTGNTNFNFKEDGSVELQIEYTATAATASDSIASNVLAIESTPKEVKELRDSIREAKSAEGLISIDPGVVNKARQRALAKAREKLDKKLERQKLSNYTGFINYLYKKKRLWSFNIKETLYRSGIYKPEVRKGKERKPRLVRKSQVREILAAGKNIKKEGDSGELEEGEVKWGQRTIAFFYLGDLLNYAAQSLIPSAHRAAGFNIDSATNPQSKEIVVGDYVFHIFPAGGSINSPEEYQSKVSTKRINLTKLPVSMTMYNKFMYDNVIKRQASSWSFDKFLKKVVPQLIDNAVNSFVQSRKFNNIAREFTKYRSAISNSEVSGYCPGLAEARKSGVAIDMDNADIVKAFNLEIHAPIIDSFLPDPIDTAIDFIGAEQISDFTIIHGSRLDPREDTGHDEQFDAEKGIYHLSVGNAYGIVKSIAFVQQQSGQRDINLVKSMENHASDPTAFVRMPYNATVRLFGVPIFKPGQQLFINPSATGVGDINSRQAISSALGLGGFYSVITVATKMSAGLMETTLSCMWEDYAPPPLPAADPLAGAGDFINTTQDIEADPTPGDGGGNRRPGGLGFGNSGNALV
jgi:hypothetical protein